MITVSGQNRGVRGDGVLKERSYTQIVDYLNSCIPYEYSKKSIERMTVLDKHLGSVSKKLEVITIAGSNGKSSTLHFASKFFVEEGFKVGQAYSQHVLTYHERIAINSQNISHKGLVSVVNHVINAVIECKIHATVFEIMTMSALLYFHKQGVDVAFFEVFMGGQHDATSFFRPLITAITRIADDHVQEFDHDLDCLTAHMVNGAKKGSFVISAEQGKRRLQQMKELCEHVGARWTMPIRKLAPLPYVFEQLYGRSAALAERIAQLYVERIKKKYSPFLRGNLLATKKGQRGRPTLQEKRLAELNPIQTIRGFWDDNFNLLRGRFELLDKEKPTVLLDNARNIDAFNNLFLGIRLLHYQHMIKGFVLVIGFVKSVDLCEVFKLVRYTFKKVQGKVFFVKVPGSEDAHDVDEIMIEAKRFGVQAQNFSSFDKAFDAAKADVDPRHGLVCVTGSTNMVRVYWHYRGIKKLS